MSLTLVATAGDRFLALHSGRPLLVGRAVACDLPIADPTVSRQHAEIQLVDGSVLVRDLESTNGTFYNGEKIREALVPPGSRIAFGKVEFLVHAEEPAPAPEPSSDEGILDATILRRRPVSGVNIAARLSGVPTGSSRLRIGGDSTADRQAKKLDLLLDIARELSQQTEPDHLLAKAVDVAFQVMSVDRVAVLLAGEDGELEPRISRRGDRQEQDWRVPRAIARKVVSERVALLIENVPADQRFEGTIHRQRVQSALCAPLLGRQGTVLGLVYLDNLDAPCSFSEEDLEFLTAFSGMVAMALENSQLIERVRREAVVLSNFQRYFAPDLARQISGEGEAIQLGGAKRRVAILFSDIRGFTSLSEHMSPDGIATLLTGYFTEMVEVVFEHGGTLDKFMGDALMALWGAPLAREDDADRAIQAAIAMQRRLERLNAEWTRDSRPPLAVGIGLSIGEVFAGNIGSDRRLEYTVIGDAVNTAARLCSEASPGEILITDSLYSSLDSPPPVSALAPLPLKGKARAVPVYRVEWAEEPPARERETAGDSSGSTSRTLHVGSDVPEI